ncbi:EamA family transporter [Anaerovoracaceae bacterium 42-11]
MDNRKTELASVLGLLIAALLWGISYPLTKCVEDCPTFYTVSLRFLTAGIFMAIVFCKRLKKMNKTILKYAFLLSFGLTCMYIFSTLGIKYTTSVRASFFTSLSFVIVPLLNLLIFRLRLTKITVISVLICTVGMFLLTYTPDMGSFGLNIGDFICILAATAGSLHIILLDRVTKKEGMDPMLFTTMLMLFIALWGTLIALPTGAFAYKGTGLQLGTIVALGLLCSAAAFLLQSICQKYVPSNRVGIILAMEPASGCMLSVLLLGEVMSLGAWIGAAVIMGSLLYMEVATSKEEQKIKLNEEAV